MTVTSTPLSPWLTAALAGRHDANDAFFGREAGRIAELCAAMAPRFAGGARLLALGASPAMRSDARHIAVEFVHPVIVGKRALPALALTADGGAIGRQLELLLEPNDIVVGFGEDALVGWALSYARAHGALTIGAPSAAADWSFAVDSQDAATVQEITETLYHLLWELVHVFLEHQTTSSSGGGAAGFLYPFLTSKGGALRELLDDVEQSVRLKAGAIDDLRRQTLVSEGGAIVIAATALAECITLGGKVLVCGNGGSATDAMDLVADFREPPNGWEAVPAIDLTEDVGVITAVANDVGVESIFRRQVIAYGTSADALITLSTSGNSTNIIAALGEAQRRGLLTIALAGYGGGRIANESLADHVIVVRSEDIPRIQEAQATVYHLLRELVSGSRHSS